MNKVLTKMKSVLSKVSYCSREKFDLQRAGVQSRHGKEHVRLQDSGQLTSQQMYHLS